MKLDLIPPVLGCLAVALALTTGDAFAQGTITFNAHPHFSGFSYSEGGMVIRLINPVPNYGMGVVGPITVPSGIPYSTTPYMGYVQQNYPHDWAVLSLLNGSNFGLARVDLADPVSPSFSMLPITLVGLRVDGSTVNQTFITPGGGANSFLTYQLNSDFASGLLSVKIAATRWAMDNLVFTIPEPAAGSLLALGLLALGWARGLPGSRSSARLEPPPAKIKN